MKYEQWLDQWLYYLKPTVKTSTLQQYKLYAENVIKPMLGMYEIDDLSGPIMQDAITKLSERYSTATMKGIASIIKRSLKSAEEMEVTAKSISEKIKYRYKRKTNIKCLTQAQQKKLESYVCGVGTPKLYGIIICLYTGIRVGELLALTWNDMDLKSGIMKINKTCNDCYEGNGYNKIIDAPKTTSSKREIPLPKELIEILKEQKQLSCGEYVITGSEGKLTAGSVTVDM